MMDWLAEVYVLRASKAAFFIQNPTSCEWIRWVQLGFSRTT